MTRLSAPALLAVIHAISEEAKAFYLGLGLLPSPTNDLTLMIPIGDLHANL